MVGVVSVDVIVSVVVASVVVVVVVVVDVLVVLVDVVDVVVGVVVVVDASVVDVVVVDKLQRASSRHTSQSAPVQPARQAQTPLNACHTDRPAGPPQISPGAPLHVVLQRPGASVNTFMDASQKQLLPFYN